MSIGTLASTPRRRTVKPRRMWKRSPYCRRCRKSITPGDGYCGAAPCQKRKAWEMARKARRWIPIRQERRMNVVEPMRCVCGATDFDHPRRNNGRRGSCPMTGCPEYFERGT